MAVEHESNSAPRWFLAWTLGMIAQAGVIVWWAASMSAKLDFLQVSVAQSTAMQAVKMQELSDDSKLMSLQIQRLDKEYAILRDRLTRDVLREVKP